MKLDVKVLNLSNNELPKYACPGDSGMDVRAYLPTGSIQLYPGEFKIIPTGLYFRIPEGYEFQVRPRSGLAAKYGITVLNTPGTIDSKYYGELKIILKNSGNQLFTVNSGDRIAQIVLQEVPVCSWVPVSEFESEDNDPSARSGQGFGHSGVK